jgi:hypothetical protein
MRTASTSGKSVRNCSFVFQEPLLFKIARNCSKLSENVSLAQPSHFRYLFTVPERQRATLISLLLALVTLAIYWPATHFDFINYDDPDYIFFSTPLQHGLNRDAVIWAFTTDHASNWHPLTWISHALDITFYGMNPGGHHFTSLLLHAANAALLFLVLWQLTGAQWRSALVAALFAWHPLHVESVAWISERKDVLCAFFCLLTLSAYAKYAVRDRERGAANSSVRRSTIFYFLALISFALALLSKPMAVTLPFVLLLVDFWPLNRFSISAPKIFLEKIPFLIVAALDCLATFWAQKQSNAVVSSAALPFSDRLTNALVSYVLYLWKMIWPVNLAVPYPYSREWSFGIAAAAALLLLLISAVALAQARRRPFLIVGWLWFLGMLVPVIGLVQVGIQFMADRYSYLPLIGIFIMAAWAIPEAWAHWPRPGLIFGAVTGGILFFLMAGAETQLQYWRNSIALFSHTVAVTSNNILAEYNLAEAYSRMGDEEQALAHYQAALAIHPNRVEAQYNSQAETHFNLGLIYNAQKKWTEADAQFRAFLRDRPNEAIGHSALGLLLVREGRLDEATEEFRKALRLRSSNSAPLDEIEVLRTLETSCAQAGRIPDAIATAEKIRTTALAQGKKDTAAAAEKRIATYRAAKP